MSAKPASLQQVRQAVARVAEVIVGRLVNLPFMRSDQQQTAARPQGARDFPERRAWFAQVLQRHDIEGRVEAAAAKREGQ